MPDKTKKPVRETSPSGPSDYDHSLFKKPSPSTSKIRTAFPNKRKIFSPLKITFSAIVLVVGGAFLLLNYLSKINFDSGRSMSYVYGVVKKNIPKDFAISNISFSRDKKEEKGGSSFKEVIVRGMDSKRSKELRIKMPVLSYLMGAKVETYPSSELSGYNANNRPQEIDRTTIDKIDFSKFIEATKKAKQEVKEKFGQENGLNRVRLNINNSGVGNIYSVEVFGKKAGEKKFSSKQKTIYYDAYDVIFDKDLKILKTTESK